MHVVCYVDPHTRVNCGCFVVPYLDFVVDFRQFIIVYVRNFAKSFDEMGRYKINTIKCYRNIIYNNTSNKDDWYGRNM